MTDEEIRGMIDYLRSAGLTATAEDRLVLMLEELLRLRNA